MRRSSDDEGRPRPSAGIGGSPTPARPHPSRPPPVSACSNRAQLAGRKVHGAVFALAAILLLSRHNPAHAELPPAYGGILRLSAPTPFTAPDPLRARTPFEAAIIDAVFDPLYRSDDAGTTEAVLAAGPPAISGSEVRIPLRTGVRTHDGRPLLPQDVLASLVRASRDATAGWLLGGFRFEGGALAASLEGDNTLLLHRSRDAGDVARALAARSLAIAVRRGPGLLVGTGPFAWRSVENGARLVEFRPSPSISPFLEAVRIDSPLPRNRALRAFELGQLDLSFFGAGLYDRAGDVAVTTSRAAGQGAVLIARNTAASVWRDQGSWEAFSGAIDRTRLTRAGIRPADSLDPSWRTPQRARRRVQSGGRIRVAIVAGDVFEQAVADALAGMLDAAGFTLVVEAVPLDRYDALVASGRYDVHIITVVPPRPGRQFRLGAALASLDRAADARRLLLTAPAAALELERTLAAGLDAVVLGFRVDSVTHRQRLRNVTYDALDRLDLTRIHFAREGPP